MQYLPVVSLCFSILFSALFWLTCYYAFPGTGHHMHGAALPQSSVEQLVPRTDDHQRCIWRLHRHLGRYINGHLYRPACQQKNSKDFHFWFQTFAVFCMLYVFFWVIPRRLNFICRRFGTVCLFYLHRQVGKKIYLLAYEDGTDSVPKRRHIKFRSREINQKKTYNKDFHCPNKSPTRCNNFPVYYPDVYLQFNMFRAFSRLSSGAQWLQWQPLVLPSHRGDSRTVFMVGPVITTIRR